MKCNQDGMFSTTDVYDLSYLTVINFLQFDENVRMSFASSSVNSFPLSSIHNSNIEDKLGKRSLSERINSSFERSTDLKHSLIHTCAMGICNEMLDIS